MDSQPLSGLPKTQPETGAGATLVACGTRRIIPVASVLTVAQHIGFTVEYKSRCLHLLLHDAFFKSVKFSGPVDSISRPRAVINYHEYAAGLQCVEHRFVHCSPVDAQPNRIVI